MEREKNDKKDIISFIKEYDINWKEASKCQGVKTWEKCASRFETKNDFFIQERVGYFLCKYPYASSSDLVAKVIYSLKVYFLIQIYLHI